MRTSAGIAGLFAVALLTLAGCDQPTTPAAFVPPVSQVPPVLQGQITALTLQPENGSTVRAEDCEEAIYCNDGVRFVFDVQLNQDVTASLEASFHNDSQQCAIAFGAGSGPKVIRANTATTFTLDYMLFVDIVDNFLCPLPQRTTRMVVELWQYGRSAPLLTQEFAHAYSFVPQ